MTTNPFRQRVTNGPTWNRLSDAFKYSDSPYDGSFLTAEFTFPEQQFGRSKQGRVWGLTRLSRVKPLVLVAFYPVRNIGYSEELDLGQMWDITYNFQARTGEGVLRCMADYSG